MWWLDMLYPGMSVLPVNTRFCSRMGEFLMLRCGNQQDLYYFLTEIHVQSSAGAQRGLISEAGNLRHGFSGGTEESTDTSYTQNSPRVMIM